MSEVNEPTGQGAVLTRLGLIEDQPLETRAVAYVQLHDELRTRLEGGDVAANRA